VQKIEDNHLVVQSNPLVEGQYKLDLIPQKLIRHLVSMIKPSDDQFEKKYYRLFASNFAILTGSNEKNIYEQIKEAAHKLKRTSITIRKKKSTIVTSWLSSFEYHDREGWIEFEFSSKLEAELLKIQEQFTQYHLVNISKLKSQYSIRLYELLRQHVVIGSREIKIDELKTMLGIGKDEYKLFGDIRARVLKPAYIEINAKTDLEYQWKPVKHVRKAVGVRFYDIQAKRNIPTWTIGLLPQGLRENKDILKNIRRWLELRGEDYIKEKIQYTISRAPANFGDYLFAALEKNYGEGFNPDQQELFPEGAKAGYHVADGVKIEIEGKIYVVEDGYIRTEKGIIAKGQIRKGIETGEFTVIDILKQP